MDVGDVCQIFHIFLRRRRGEFNRGFAIVTQWEACEETAGKQKEIIQRKCVKSKSWHGGHCAALKKRRWPNMKFLKNSVVFFFLLPSFWLYTEGGQSYLRRSEEFGGAWRGRGASKSTTVSYNYVQWYGKAFHAFFPPPKGWDIMVGDISQYTGLYDASRHERGSGGESCFGGTSGRGRLCRFCCCFFFSVPSAAIKADATKKGEVVNSTGEKNKNNI